MHQESLALRARRKGAIVEFSVRLTIGTPAGSRLCKIASNIRELSIEAHLPLTQGFKASDLVFDITKTTEQLQAEGEAEAGLSEWLDECKNTEAIAGVMLVICHGSKV